MMSVMVSFRSPFLLILVANLVVFYPAVNSVLFWDDGLLFRGNLLSGAGHPLVYWMGDYSFYKTWPTPFAMLKLLHLAIGEQYWLYKVFSIFLHTLSATLLFQLLQRFFSRQRSLVIALVFSLHPMQVESVLWIFQLNTLLATFFLLASCWFLLERRGWPFYALALGAFYLSVTSKALALFFPLLFAYLWVYRGESWRRALLLMLPFLGLSCYHGGLAYRGTFSFEGEERFQQSVQAPRLVEQEEVAEETTEEQTAEMTEEPAPLFQTAVNWGKGLVFVQSFAFYLGKFLLPYPLLFMYPEQSPYWIWEVLVLLMLIGFVLAGRKHKPDSMFFFLCWVLAFLPTSGIAYIAYFKFGFVANRYMYLGLVGLIGLMSSWVRPPRKVVVVALVALGVITWHYGRVFTNPVEVYEHNYRHNPQNIYPLILLAGEYAGKGEEKLAVATLARIVLNPQARYFLSFFAVVERVSGWEPTRWIFLSHWHKNRGDLEEARRQLQKGLLMHPSSAELRAHLEDL